MMNEPTDAMLDWIEQQQLIEWEAEMNEEPIEQLSTIACNPLHSLPYYVHA